jgi:tellurite resistance protein
LVRRLYAVVHTKLLNMPNSAQQSTFLAFLPVSFFGAIMGLSGLIISRRPAHDRWGVPGIIEESIGGFTLAAFVALLVTYAIKCWYHPEIVKKEWQHPVMISFFATVPITLLLFCGDIGMGSLSFIISDKSPGLLCLKAIAFA